MAVAVVTRHCVICGSEILLCWGGTKTGDMMEVNEGMRHHSAVRSFCDRCITNGRAIAYCQGDFDRKYHRTGYGVPSYDWSERVGGYG